MSRPLIRRGVSNSSTTSRIGTWRVSSCERICETRRRPSSLPTLRLRMMRSKRFCLLIVSASAADVATVVLWPWPASVSQILALAAALLSASSTWPALPLSFSDAASADISSNWPQVSSRRRHSSIIIFRRTSERTRANSASSLTGLVRKSSAPASRPRTRSFGSERAVTMTTGMCRVRGLALMRWQTSKPSMPGIMTSSRTMSGALAAMASSAAAPLSAVMTSKYSAESLASSRRTFAGISSTTRTRADIRLSTHDARPILLFGSLAQKLLDRLEEIGDRDRLGDIGLAAALADLLLVALHGEGRHGNDRDGLQRIIFLDPFGHFQAGDLRQLDVHKDKVGPVLAGQLQRFHAIARLQDIVPVRFEQVMEELHVELIVLDDQNRLRLSQLRRRGRFLLQPRTNRCGNYVILGHFSSPSLSSGMVPKTRCIAGRQQTLCPYCDPSRITSLSLTIS